MNENNFKLNVQVLFIHLSYKESEGEKRQMVKKFYF